MSQIKPSYDTKRQKLSEIIPLDSALSMYIEPTRKCNLKCFYCMHATRGIPGGILEQNGFRIADMDMALYERLIQQVMSFPTPVKRVCFSGLGEPLMNPRLPEMIRMLRNAGYQGRIDVITNGVLLTPQVADALVAAGISRIQISVQGLSTEKYQEVCGVPVDLAQYQENIRYLFEHKGQATIFIKIIDAILEEEGPGAKERFMELFGAICDTIFVEHLVIMEQQMGDHGGRADSSRNLNGEYVEKRFVCGVMFYFLQVNIDGETFPCSTPGLPNSFSMGCMKDQTLQEIWNGERRGAMLRKNLTDGYASIPACSQCSSCIAIADDTEYLDDCREDLLQRLGQ